MKVMNICINREQFSCRYIVDIAAAACLHSAPVLDWAVVIWLNLAQRRINQSQDADAMRQHSGATHNDGFMLQIIIITIDEYDQNV